MSEKDLLDYEEDDTGQNTSDIETADAVIGRQSPLAGNSGQNSGALPTDLPSQGRARRDDRIFEELRKLSSSVQGIANRVGKLESERSSRRPATKRSRATESRSTSPAPLRQREQRHPSPEKRRRQRPSEASSSEMDWASRDAENDRDPNPDPVWSESEDDDHEIPLSESNINLLTSAFSSTLSNAERRKIRRVFPVPSVSQTRCPRLDAVFKTSAKGDVKTADTEMSKIQALILDPVGPLTRLLHASDDEGSGDPISQEDAREAVSGALRLIGNASNQVSKLRRKKILKAVNPELQDLAEEDLFTEAAPALFGSTFKEKMQQRSQSLQLIARAAKPPSGSKKFFRGGRSTGPQRGSGQANRGGKSNSWWQKKKATSNK